MGFSKLWTTSETSMEGKQIQKCIFWHTHRFRTHNHPKCCAPQLQLPWCPMLALGSEVMADMVFRNDENNGCVSKWQLTWCSARPNASPVWMLPRSLFLLTTQFVMAKCGPDGFNDFFRQVQDGHFGRYASVRSTPKTSHRTLPRISSHLVSSPRFSCQDLVIWLKLFSTPVILAERCSTPVLSSKRLWTQPSSCQFSSVRTGKNDAHQPFAHRVPPPPPLRTLYTQEGNRNCCSKNGSPCQNRGMMLNNVY